MLPSIAFSRASAALSNAASDVMVGMVRYLCLKNTVSLTLTALVSFNKTRKHRYCSKEVPMLKPKVECGAQVSLVVGLR